MFWVQRVTQAGVFGAHYAQHLAQGVLEERLARFLREEPELFYEVGVREEVDVRGLIRGQRPTESE